MEPLSEVQLAFMRALWSAPRSSVAKVKAALAEQGRVLASTTVATQLGRLEKKGLITHETHGRQYLYSAVVSKQEVRRSALARLRDGLFGGNVTALVHQLLDHDEVSADDLAAAKRLIEAREAEEDRS